MIVGAVMLFFGVNYLKGFNPLAQQDHFFAVYDKIEGLAVSNPVLVNGFKVGQVTRVEFHDSGDGKILVEFTVDQSDLNIPINSVAQIFSSDLLDSLIVENRAVLNSVMTNLDGLAENLNNNNDELSNIIQNFSLVSDSIVLADIAGTIKKADTALENITEITENAKNGKGTLGKIIVDDSLYNGLVASSIELNELLDDLQLNPWKYVRVSLFGRKQQAKMSKGDLKRMRKMIREEIEAEENEIK